MYQKKLFYNIIIRIIFYYFLGRRIAADLGCKMVVRDARGGLGSGEGLGLALANGEGLEETEGKGPGFFFG